MSMVINLVEDHNIYLCEGGPVYNGGVQPTPITYLTQWKIVGNSEVHTDPYLTSWRVSGNSIVDNNTILSCGDYSAVDGKYHVKISNGVDVFDIALTEPLRKVNNVADTIEIPSGTEGKALVTRNIVCVNLGELSYGWGRIGSNPNYCLENNDNFNISPPGNNDKAVDIVCPIYAAKSYRKLYTGADTGIGLTMRGEIRLRDSNYDYADGKDAFVAHLQGIEALFILATPTTELVDAPQISVSPTDTYASANVVPYSAFEHTENNEIWSCGEYNPTDGKYHILVQPLGGSIADIALDEPLRKVNDVADTIEFPSDTEGKALVTRKNDAIPLKDLDFSYNANRLSFDASYFNNRGFVSKAYISNSENNMLTSEYEWIKWQSAATVVTEDLKIMMSGNGDVKIRDLRYDNTNDFYAHIDSYVLFFILATPTTELVDAPQIEEADSYSCVISQGAKAVSWSSFETE